MRCEQAKRDTKARSAREQDNSEPRRPKNRAGKARRYFRRSGEQLAVAEGAQRDTEARSARQYSSDILPLVSHCNGRVPSRSFPGRLRSGTAAAHTGHFHHLCPSLGAAFAGSSPSMPF